MNEMTLAGRLLVTPVEAATALGISRTRVYELMAAGQLRSVKIGRSRRIPVKVLIAFVTAMAEDSAA
jgi:excisionase family DNA binding protein